MVPSRFVLSRYLLICIGKIARTRSLLPRSGSSSRHPVLAAAIEREILWRLINGAQGARVRQIGFADSRMAQIGRAIRWVRGHYARALRIDDLARIAGMSMSSFHRHFQAVTSMTPIQYQKQIRLQTARTLLMSAAKDVVAVGVAVGYESPSQFSREYRRQFGEAPGKDRKRLREMKEVVQSGKNWRGNDRGRRLPWEERG